MNFGAVIADVIAHRRVRNWPIRQKQLLEIAESLSEKFGNSLVFPVVMSGGDRLVAIFREPHALNSFLLDFEEEMFLKNLKLKLRWGIGLGDLNVTNSPHTTTGEALYRAQEALEYAHREHISFAFSTGDERISRLLTVMKNAAFGIKSKWTHRQRELWKACIKLKRNHDEITQRKLACLLRISQPAVSRMMKTMLFEEQKLLEEEISTWLLYNF